MYTSFSSSSSSDVPSAPEETHAQEFVRDESWLPDTRFVATWADDDCVGGYAPISPALTLPPEHFHFTLDFRGYFLLIEQLSRSIVCSKQNVKALISPLVLEQYFVSLLWLRLAKIRAHDPILEHVDPIVSQFTADYSRSYAVPTAIASYLSSLGWFSDARGHIAVPNITLPNPDGTFGQIEQAAMLYARNIAPAIITSNLTAVCTGQVHPVVPPAMTAGHYAPDAQGCLGFRSELQLPTASFQRQLRFWPRSLTYEQFGWHADFMEHVSAKLKALGSGIVMLDFANQTVYGRSIQVAGVRYDDGPPAGHVDIITCQPRDIPKWAKAVSVFGFRRDNPPGIPPPAPLQVCHSTAVPAADAAVPPPIFDDQRTSEYDDELAWAGRLVASALPRITLVGELASVFICAPDKGGRPP